MIKETLYKKISFCCLSILLVAITYSHLKEIGFCTADDKWMLLYNPLVKRISFKVSYIITLLTSFNDIQYSPLNTLYYGFIFKINGFDPYYYHLCSLIIHVANSILIFIISKKLLSIFNIKNVGFISFITAIFWVINPINVEAVVWISASKVLLFSFFSLLAFLAFINAIKKDSIIYYVLCFLCLSLSFFSKEQSVVTPIMFLAFAKCYCHIKNTTLATNKLVLFFIITLITTFLFGFIALKANGAELNSISKYPFFQRFILSFYCLFFYIFNVLIPVGLHYNYSFPMAPGQPLPIVYYSFPALFIISVGLFLSNYRKKTLNPFYGFCCLAFIIQLGLCLQIVPMTRPAIMADRYIYLPSMFLLLIFTSIFINNFYFKKGIKIQRLLIICSIAYVIFFVHYGNILVLNWQNLSIR